MIIGRCILTYNLIKDGMSFMKSMIRAAMRLFFGGCFSVSVYGQATSDHKSLDPVIDSALAGYNAGDSKAFFAGYAKALAAVATEPMFNMMYKDNYFKAYGKYLSRRPLDAETVFDADTPLVVYQAEFEKNKKVKISVNFMKEEGVYRVVQIQFNPM
jgi:hypothetical protein